MDWSVFIVFFAACCAAAATGSLFPPGRWYREIAKPSWTPPDWLFPVAWTVLYIASAVAATRVSVLEGAAMGMAFWALQIALNTLWSPVFFGLRRLRAALIVVAGLWVAVLGALLSFWMLDRVAGLLMLPYLAWVTVAGALNAWIWLNNPEPERQEA